MRAATVYVCMYVCMCVCMLCHCTSHLTRTHSPDAQSNSWILHKEVLLTYLLLACLLAYLLTYLLNLQSSSWILTKRSKK